MTSHTIIISTKSLQRLLREATSLTLKHDGNRSLSMGLDGDVMCDCKSGPFEYAMKLEQANRLAAIMAQLAEQPVVLRIEEGSFFLQLTQLSI